MDLTAAQLDRACGAVVASAVGDALGAGYEFGSAPYDGAPAMIGGGLGGFAPGEWTDDTAQAVAIAQSLADAAVAGADPRSAGVLDAIAARFADWYAGRPPDIGIQTAAVLRAGGDHPSAADLAAAAEAEHHRSGRSAGNGSLMRTGPLALAFLGPGQEPALVEAAHAISALTHHDPLAGDGAALWSLMVRHAVLEGDLAFGDLPRFLRDPEQWRGLSSAAAAGDPSSYTENGWVVGAFLAAYSSVVSTPVPEGVPSRHLQDALATAIGIGHDTDTVAAIAGALLGARWGLSAVPLEWLRVLHGWPGLRAPDLVALATRISTSTPEGAWPFTDWIDYGDLGDAFVAHPLVDRLWIGGASVLDDLPVAVDAVVSLCRVGAAQVPAGLENVQVRLLDTVADDNPHLDVVIDDAARTTLALLAEDKRVYLHCAAGQSRTPTVATRVAVLAGHDTDEALRAVVGALPAARPQQFLVDALHRLARGGGGGL